MTPVILPRSDHTISRKNIDADALKVLYRLKQAGHTAYLVGGGVRDLLLGRRPKDFDISTSAHPNDVRRLFRNCRLIGRRFRLAHILFGGGKIVEVATFRRKSDEEPAGDAADLLVRRENTFGSPEEDAERRDYTINGLFYDIATFSVIDYVGGLKDLEERTIRTIGDPVVRMQEDPVRMLRAIKFAARLDFQIAPEDLEAIARCRGDLLRTAPERLLLEWGRLLGGGSAAKAFRLMEETGLLATLVPELARFLVRPQARGVPASDAAHGNVLWRDLSGLDRLVAERKGNRPDLSIPVLLGAALTPFVMDALGIAAPRAGSGYVPAVVERRGLGFAAGLDLGSLDDTAAFTSPAENGSTPGSAAGEAGDEEFEALPGDAIGTSGNGDSAAEEIPDETASEAAEAAVTPFDAESDDEGESPDEGESDDEAALGEDDGATFSGDAGDDEATTEEEPDGPDALAPGSSRGSGLAHRRTRRQLPVFAGSDPASRVGELLAPFILRFAVPRRDTERLIQVVAAQKKMRAPGRRSPSQRALARKQYFPEALELFELHVRGAGQGEAELRLWKSLAAREGPASPDDRDDRRGSRTGARRRGRRGRGGSPERGAVERERPEHERPRAAAHPARERTAREPHRAAPAAEDRATTPSDTDFSDAEEAALRRKAEADQMLREAAFQHPRHLPTRASAHSFPAPAARSAAPERAPSWGDAADSPASVDKRRRRRRRRGGRPPGGPPRATEG